MHKTKSGFTIVELLIVIVVIGILAAITIVAYNGIQQRAGNAAREHTASEMLKIVKAYAALNGSEPLKTALPEPYTLINSSACVGSGFVDANSDGRADCFSYLPSQAEAVSSNSTIDSLLASTGIKGSGVYPPVNSNSTYTTNGSWLIHWPTIYVANNEVAPLLFAYWLDGENHKCNVGVQARFDRTEGSISYYIDDTQALNFSTGSGATLCAVHIK